ncbi:MAG: hypothetical protein ACXVCE_18080 [Bacteriovorax sp.]
MISLAAWYYRTLLFENDLIEKINYFEIEQFGGIRHHEALVFLKKKHMPEWLSHSELYSSCDGTGTSQYKNTAVYKAISEALERWAFYLTIESNESNKYCFDINPSTTGMAAYPGLTTKVPRENAILEASERWALHEFWRGNLPIIEHKTKIEDLHHYEIVTELNNIKISLLSYKSDSKYLYAFAADRMLKNSYEHALIELSRNLRVMKKLTKENINFNNFKDISDKRLIYFASTEGYDLFNSKIHSAPKSPLTKSKLICDQELKGPWNKYTKVWRYLYANSYPDSEDDHTIFMF